MNVALRVGTLSLCGLAAAAWGCATTKGGGVENQVSFESLPQNVGEFVALRDAMAVHPEGGAACVVLAGLMYAQDEVLGLQALMAMMDGKALQGPAVAGKPGPVKGEVDRFKARWSKETGHDHVPRSYVQGTSPVDGYKLGQPPYVIKLKAREEEKGVTRVLVYSTGADHARPMMLRRNDQGVWQMTNWEALLADVKLPERK